MRFRPRPLLFALLAVALSAAAARAEAVDPAAVDAVVADALKAWRVPGVAVAIVRDGEVIYLKGHGVKEIDGKDPVTPDTLFPVGSCTKAFTTAAMAVLVDEGKMGWDDPVRKHVPFFHLSDPLADREVVLRDLVCHRTGVGGNDLLWYRSPWSQEEIIRRVGKVPLDLPFRTRFQYQTTMFTVAGFAVASASGTPWHEFVQKRLFDPLQMTESCFTTTEAAKGDHAGAHRLNRLGRPEVIPWYAMEVPDPAGSIDSSARDLAKWLRFQLGDGSAGKKRIVSTANLAELHTPQMLIRLEGNEHLLHPDTQQMSYGMGWVIEDYRGVKLWSHAGAIDGFRAHLTMIPGEKIGVVVLANLEHTRMNLALSNSLLDLLLGLPRRDWNAVIADAVRKDREAAADRLREREAARHRNTTPSHELAAYVGAYEHPAYGTARVALEKGALVWTWNRFTSPLEHYHYDHFNAVLEDIAPTQIAFGLDDAGNVSSLKVLAPLNVEFHKVQPAPSP